MQRMHFRSQSGVIPKSFAWPEIFFSALHICTGCSTTAAAGFLPSLNWMIFSSNWEKSFPASAAASGRNERNETIQCNKSHNHPIERFIYKTRSKLSIDAIKTDKISNYFNLIMHSCIHAFNSTIPSSNNQLVCPPHFP